MAHINPSLPSDGQQAWAPTADAYLSTLTNQINLHDDLLASLAGGTAGVTVVDNGDGTVTITPASTSTVSGTTFTTASPGIAYDADGTPYLA